MDEIKEEKNSNVLERLIIRSISAVLFTGMFVLIENMDRVNELDSLNDFSNLRYLLMLVCVFCGLTVLELLCFRFFVVKLDLFFLLTASIGYGLLIACKTTNVYYISVVSLLVLLVVRYVLNHRSCRQFLKADMSIRSMKLSIGVFVILVFLYLLLLTALRLFLMKAVTFDFGIFVQMFHYMKKCLIPYTTCERYHLVSHFTIHFSPIFYLILPVYAIFSSPMTLIFVQLAAVVSGVIPVYLMCRRKNLSKVATFCMCGVYLLYPALRGGLFYDFHENKFLAPLVLWLLYFMDREKFDRKKIAAIAIFTLLILAVKEDAPIYTACIGLYYSLGRGDNKQKITGFFMFLVSVAYFFIVFYFMGRYSDGGGAITSFGRYENLTVNGYQGIGNLVMTMLKNPAYVMKQLLTAEKLEFFLWMFLPVLFLPFQSKRISTYLLLVPMVVLNLLSDYTYQHSIYYQYAYASGVLVIYLAFLEIGEKKENCGKKTAVSMLVVTLLLSISCISDRNEYFGEYLRDREMYEEMYALLDEIPRDASVSATTTLVPVLAERDEIYKHSAGDQQDYIVFSLRTSSKENYLAEADDYLNNGYQIFGEVEDKLLILQKIK